MPLQDANPKPSSAQPLNPAESWSWGLALSAGSDRELKVLGAVIIVGIDNAGLHLNGEKVKFLSIRSDSVAPTMPASPSQVLAD